MSQRTYIVQDITTGLSWKGKPVGITRYEQEIARGLKNWDAGRGVLRFVRYDQTRRCYLWVPENEATEWLARDHMPSDKNSLRVHLSGFKLKLRDLSRKLLKKAWRTCYRSAYHTGMVISRPVGEYAERLLQLMEQWVRLAIRLSCEFIRSAPAPATLNQPPASTTGVTLQDQVDFSQVALYISCGLDWDDKDTAAIYRAKTLYGFRCIFTIYDMVPSLFPEFLPRDPGRYIRYFADALWTADRILTISESSRRDIEAFADTHLLPKPPIDIVSPGSDLENPSEMATPLTKGKVHEVIQNAGNYALSVGTIEVRKNHQLLINIWLELLQTLEKSIMPHLVLVGGRGWGFEDLFRTLDAWPELSSYVHILEGLSDHELALVYAHCDLFLYPSFYEGWGIPLTEAAAFGKPIISSSSSSMPEAAPHELTRFLDPLDYPAWLAAIQEWATQRGTPQPQSINGTHSVRTWQQAGIDFVTKILGSSNLSVAPQYES